VSGKFKKTSAKHPAPAKRQLHGSLQKRKQDGDTKTPATRVGDGRDHHDTLSTKVLYVLVDQPKEPEDSVTLEHGSQVFPLLFTTNGEPLVDTTLVFLLAFEHVVESGKFTLKLKRGDSEAELFADVDYKDLFLYDPNVVYGPKEDEIVLFNRRELDYRTIPPRPPHDDGDLDSAQGSYASITDGAS
jgi:hypothetical protein